MPNQDMISGLIETYRVLNNSVRMVPESQLRTPGSDGNSVREVIRRLRDDELRFSQALKERVTGVPMPDIFGDEIPVVGTESSDDTTGAIIAQFGTARESTLAMVRALTPEEWDQAIEGGTTIRTRIEDLVKNDRAQLDRILTMVSPR
jgi:hypothetical protein